MLSYELHQGTRIDWYSMNKLVYKAYEIVDSSNNIGESKNELSTIVNTKSSDAKTFKALLTNPLCVEYFRYEFSSNFLIGKDDSWRVSIQKV